MLKADRTTAIEKKRNTRLIYSEDLRLSQIRASTCAAVQKKSHDSSGDQEQKSNLSDVLRKITKREIQRKKVVDSFSYRKDYFNLVFTTFAGSFCREDSH